MSTAMVESEKSSDVAEKALRALWMFDVTAFESCRCTCCGGLRQIDREAVVAPGSPSIAGEPAAGSGPA
jgi:hypothetical protein